MMRNLVALCFSLLIGTACTSDIDTPEQKAGPEPDEADMIVGTWKAKELQVDEQQASDEEIYAKGILDYLTEAGCEVLTFTFERNGEMSTRSKAAYLEVSFGLQGLVIPCPEETDEETGTYSYESGILTVTEPDGHTIDINAEIIDGEMHMDAGDLEIPELSTGGTLVLVKV